MNKITAIIKTIRVTHDEDVFIDQKTAKEIADNVDVRTVEVYDVTDQFTGEAHGHFCPVLWETQLELDFGDE